METIFVNGSIWTGDPLNPRAEALAIKSARIEAIGSNSEILNLRKTNHKIRIEDLGGKTIFPGFTDCHTHLVTGGLYLMGVDLKPAKSPDDFRRIIFDKASNSSPGRWVLGGNWDHETWPGAPFPDKSWIDDATADVPVFVTRIDLHVGLANSAALRAAGITRDTPDPCGGVIVRNQSTGEPTGLLKDKAINLLSEAVPRPTRQEMSDALRLALRHAAAHGVTSVQDITDWGDPSWQQWNLFQDFRDRGELTCRIFARLPLIDWDRSNSNLPPFITGPYADPWLRFGGLKGFMDGSLGSRTAFFFHPYEDDPDCCGLLMDEMFPDGAMERRIREADKAGIPVSVHAIGDRANAMLIDIFQNVVSTNGSRDRRFRVEHAQHLRREDIARMAALGLTASIQPAQVLDDGCWADQRIGRGRCSGAYAFKSMQEAGLLLAGGSDWPVSPLDPIRGIYAAVSRCPDNDSCPGGWQPEQKLSIHDAVNCFTINPAYAEFAESEKGTLSVGKFADFVALSDDPFSVPDSELPRIKILLTVAGGKIIHST